MDIIEALASVARYNGWHETLCSIRNYLSSEMAATHSSKYWNIAFPGILGGLDPDVYPRIVWFIMAEMFGDCGCSPRTGWIDGDKSDAALKFINQLCELSGEDEEDE